ncbi:hypothetical protein Pla52n_25780 [Stieleria varia]|uniref:Uncharacterized protein n=1 Tax=Stieleria varia TaxID=2528005 RepID=A0A5C6AZS8_9BACT|nr:hypothetical protein Pla52n_25780 [Stieleria varia]
MAMETPAEVYCCRRLKRFVLSFKAEHARVPNIGDKLSSFC